MKTFFFFFFLESTCACVLGPWPWPRECLSSERLSLASFFFCVLGLGLEPCVLDSTSVKQYLNCRGAAGRRLPPSKFSIPPSRFRCPPSRFERWIIRQKRPNFSSKFDKKKKHFNFRRRSFFWSLLSSVASQGYSPPPPPWPVNQNAE